MNGDSYFNGSGMKRERGPDSMHSSNEMGDAHDAKKAKFENPPSRVVHIRSLPNEVSETDVVQLGMPFGKMTNLLLMRQKNQAFLEFADESCAVNMVSYFKSNAAQIRQKSCYVQFSNHRELKTDITNSQNAAAQAALQAASGLIGGASGGGGGGGGLGSTTVLRVIVENLLYPVSIDVLHQLFSRFGKIAKIIIFNKNNTFQALLQYLDPLSAVTARDALDGQNIYNGCNTLRIDNSRMTNLQVKFNNDRSRDFTRPDLPSGDGMMDERLGARDLMGLGGPLQRAGVLGNPAGVGGLGGLGGLGGPGRFNFNSLQDSQLGGNQFGNQNQMGNMGMGGRGGDTHSPVLLVSNFDEEKATPEAFFTLFGVYGNVHRVKILFNKKDNALIQMAHPEQAQQAITYLDRAKIWGKPLRVVPSKHMMIQMPKEDNDAGLTKDYVNSPHHRFKRQGSKNYIFPPTQVLHLYNVNVLEEDEIRNLFSQHGTIRNFKFFNNDKKMALIEMGSVEEATLALMGLHNYQIGEMLHLRVSFSKSTIN